MSKKLQFKCSNCETIFFRYNTVIVKNNKTGKFFCCSDCQKIYNRKNKSFIKCYICNKEVYKKPSSKDRSKSGLLFCSRTCSNIHNNKFKKLKSRSKIETKFGNEIQNRFPNLKFIFNDRQILNGYEIDIYIPELKLAIEWNGIVHYQPIYGEDKLKNIQYKDYQKQLLCQKLNIDLIIVADYKSDKSILDESINKISKIINTKLQ